MSRVVPVLYQAGVLMGTCGPSRAVDPGNLGPIRCEARTILSLFGTNVAGMEEGTVFRSRPEATALSVTIYYDSTEGSETS